MTTDKEIAVFCKNIKFLRQQNGLSKRKMARIMGIGVESLSKIESATLPPRVGTSIIIKLANYFQIKPGDLFSPNLQP